MSSAPNIHRISPKQTNCSCYRQQKKKEGRILLITSHLCVPSSFRKALISDLPFDSKPADINHIPAIDSGTEESEMKVRGFFSPETPSPGSD